VRSPLAQRLENVRYAIRDLALVADEVTRQGHTVLSLNVGDPNIFDFQTPAHLIEAVYRAMKDNKNGTRRRPESKKRLTPFALRPRAKASLQFRTFLSPPA